MKRVGEIAMIYVLIIISIGVGLFVVTEILLRKVIKNENIIMILSFCITMIIIAIIIVISLYIMI